MGRPSTASALKTGASTREWNSRWLGTGAGAAVPVKTNSVAGVLTRQNVGLYTLTFTDVGGKVAGFVGMTETPATVVPQIWKYVPGSLSQSLKTVQLECWSLAGLLVDPPVASTVKLEVVFFDNTVD